MMTSRHSVACFLFTRGGIEDMLPRHAHASHALERGAKIHLVKATLGHASVVTTGRYLHARPDESSAMYLAR
jgi:integrase/recombinase XerD